MNEVTPQKVKEVRERTGIGMGKCKEALVTARGDVELAIENLRKAGVAAASKKEGRETKEGMVAFAQDAHSIALVEVNAETDFVVKNERFQEFARQLAQEALAQKPKDLASFLAATSSIDANWTVDAYRASLVQSLGENIQVRRVALFPKKAQASYGAYSHGGGR